jgi:hypothetical protein
MFKYREIACKIYSGFSGGRKVKRRRHAELVSAPHRIFTRARSAQMHVANLYVAYFSGEMPKQVRHDVMVFKSDSPVFKYLLLFIFFVSLSFAALAQKPDTSLAKKTKAKDTLVSTKYDTTVTRSMGPKVKKEKIYHPDSTHSPHTAIMRSLIIPGWGQVYNHSWWKVPFIYGGFAALGASYLSNQTNLKEFLQLSHYREFGITPTVNDPYYREFQLYTNVPSQSIYDAADTYRRNRDIVILSFAAVWGIQVIEAYIHAKFIHSYSIDSNLSMRVSPEVLNQPVYAQNFTNSYIPGIKITFALR